MKISLLDWFNNTPAEKKVSALLFLIMIALCWVIVRQDTKIDKLNAVNLKNVNISVAYEQKINKIQMDFATTVIETARIRDSINTAKSDERERVFQNFINGRTSKAEQAIYQIKSVIK